MVEIIGGEEQWSTLFVAVELSKSAWVVGLTSLGDAKMHMHRVEAGDGQALGRLLALIERHRLAAARRLGRAVRVISCYEAGHDGFWLHRALSARAIANHVLDPASLLVDRRAKRAKTDRIDAAMLLRALMAWTRGDARACKPVRVPTPEQEDVRRIGRERGRLIDERTGHTNRIQGLLMTLGVRGFGAKPGTEPGLLPRCGGNPGSVPGCTRAPSPVARKLLRDSHTSGACGQIESRRCGQKCCTAQLAAIRHFWGGSRCRSGIGTG